MEIEIRLSDEEKAFVDRQVEESPHGSASAYLAALIRADAHRQLKAQTEAGLQSPGREFTNEVMTEIRQNGTRLARHAKDHPHRRVNAPTAIHEDGTDLHSNEVLRTGILAEEQGGIEQISRALDAKSARVLEVDEQQADLSGSGDITQGQKHPVTIAGGKDFPGLGETTCRASRCRDTPWVGALRAT